MNLNARFCQQLAAELERQGLTQSEFARRSGVTRAYVSQLLGQYTSPKLDTVEKVAEVLGVAPYTLLLEQVPANPPMDAELAELMGELAQLTGQRRRLVFGAIRGILGNTNP